MPDYQFRNDQPDDFLNTLREVGQWLVDSGQEMWEVQTLTPHNLIDAYTKDNCYVLYATGADGTAVPAATFILQWEDPLYYAEVPPNTVGIIHKVAIRRAFAGQNLFQVLLDFCQTECLKRGIHEIQLETDATRPALMRFYERHEFEPTYQQTIHEFGQTFVCQYYRLRF
ncbi:GNAT family N-acetyltransferase [Spirosoma utsteinense]|uniref:GNAT superfamily N-acetyltransferase n=1 Tax=Spirosoma utsteinense TaxID=2585773 RepID=A0ABR6W1U4_9BACT|nr:GNAT family N-acetyltransferase [Spirosoma utsteinense]MBC3789024.1 GNAT superfamily N-acetyltransferase [Spirosoma utsteinense]MBC3790503.1 GNAT superfamily N-acetyltransferase [Spirosoma utsteinense]